MNEIIYNQRINNGDFFVWMDVALQSATSLQRDGLNRFSESLTKYEKKRLKELETCQFLETSSDKYVSIFSKELERRIPILEERGEKSDYLNYMVGALQNLDRKNVFQIERIIQNLEPYRGKLLDIKFKNPIRQKYAV